MPPPPRFVPLSALAPALRAQLLAWARVAAPEEACGLLLGPAEGQIAAVTRAANLAAGDRRQRYLVDPEHVLDAELSARAGGPRVLGAWHSHPQGPAAPSATDRAEAWPGLVYVVVSLLAES